MDHQFCTKCAEKVMPTMRVCPNCGNKTFGSTPPSPPIAAISPNVLAPPSQQTSSIGAALRSKGQAFSATGYAGATKFEPAGHLKRVLAAMIDALIIGFITAIPIGSAYAILSPRGAENGANPVMIVMILASIVIPYVYHTLMHGSSRRATLGKQAMGLILVTVQGEQLTKVQAFIRIILTALLPVGGLLLLGLSAAGLAVQYKTEMHEAIGIAVALGALAIYIGPFITVFFNNRRQTLFDMICKTCVIKNPTP